MNNLNSNSIVCGWGRLEDTWAEPYATMLRESINDELQSGKLHITLLPNGNYHVNL